MFRTFGCWKLIMHYALQLDVCVCVCGSYAMCCPISSQIVIGSLHGVVLVLNVCVCTCVYVRVCIHVCVHNFT